MPKPSPTAAGNQIHLEKTKSSWFLDLVLILSFVAMVLILVGATVWGYFRPATASSKLAAVSMTAKPDGSKLQIWLAPPLAEWPASSPVLLTSQLVSASDKDLTVAVNVSTGTDCQPTVRAQSQGVEVRALKVPAHDRQILMVDVSFSPCSQEQLRKGVPLHVQYEWEQEFPAPTPADAKQGSQEHTVKRKLEQIASTSAIVVESESDARLARFGRAFAEGYAVLKDLAWPFVLLLIGYALQEISKHREVQQTLRAQEQERQQSRRADRQQILTHLLPDYMTLVQTHYLPIARRMQTVADTWKELESAADAASKEEANRKLLAAVLLMRRRWLHLFLLKGGVFFRTSTGEEIFGDGITRFKEKSHHELGETAFECAALALMPDATVPDAIRKFFPAAAATASGGAASAAPQSPMPAGPGAQEPEPPLPDMDAMLTKLKGWIDRDTGPGDGFGGYINLLMLCEQVLSFECDRIFYQTDPDQKTDGDACNDSSGWYFDPPQLEIKPEMCLVPSADPAADDTKKNPQAYSRSKLFALIKKYLERVPSECQPKGFRLPEDWLEKEQRKAPAAAGGAGTPP